MVFWKSLKLFVSSSRGDRQQTQKQQANSGHRGSVILLHERGRGECFFQGSTVFVLYSYLDQLSSAVVRKDIHSPFSSQS
jgi:hypothetical protein